MKSFTHYGTVFLLIIFSLAPSFASAQMYGAWDMIPIDNSSDESTTTRAQRIRGYYQQTSELQQKIAALPNIASASVSMPVLFGVSLSNISPNFGDPRSGGRTHEGEDIMAVKGTPIVSPTSAVVLRTVTGTSEGNAVYTANPGGEIFVYMHLDHFGEGVTTGTLLQPGSLIGYVGNTGNASGGAAHLHFEIHNSSGTPVDPFPRLTSELSLQDKINDLSSTLTVTADPTALATFLVTHFRSTFLIASAQGISLPNVIIGALASVPVSVNASSSGGDILILPTGDLDIGSSGVAVTELQNYLIRAASGAAAMRLTAAGATGYFGTVTKAALVEYQIAVGIAPLSGYYGATTRAFIETHPLGVPQPSTTPISLNGGAVFTRDLYRGVTGEDVRTLQRVLNAHGYVVASSGSGSIGNETNYFGVATEAAVIKFQIAYNIAPAMGYVGPLTRTAYAALTVL